VANAPKLFLRVCQHGGVSSELATKDDAPDRVKLPLSYDVEALNAAVDALEAEPFIYYDVLPLTAPAHLVDPSLPTPPPVDDYADGSWTPWLETSFLRRSSYLCGLVDEFKKHTDVTLVRLLRLAPGAVVKEHTDPTLGLHIERSVVRLTIPIKTNPLVTFHLNDELVPLLPGECWYLRFTDPHRLENGGTTERVHLSIDMIPNDWLRSTINAAVGEVPII